MDISASLFKKLYGFLIVIRACFAYFGQGYIHPDEYFQNGEVSASHILGYHTLKTWEWDPSFPVRSALAPFATTGIPFFLVKLMGQNIRPILLFHVERVCFLLLSFLLDYSVAILVPNHPSRRYALLLLASSYVVHTFQIRPFSNSLEAIILALVLCYFCKYVRDSRQDSNKNLCILAIFFVLGAFTRPTFVAFILPLSIQTLRWTTLKSLVYPSPCLIWIKAVLLPSMIAAVTSLLIVLFDTWYFQGKFAITPLNFIYYNISVNNLAEHGIHPRWLHVFVNLPMIIGPGLLWFVTLAAVDCFRHQETKNGKGLPVVKSIVDQTAAFTIISALTLLSIQPHQEPRFLLPLLVPAVVLVGNSSRIARLGKFFWVTWIILNVALAVLFGVLHQGGVVASLFYIHDQISQVKSSSNSISVFFWKTYMPPRHLMAISEKDTQSSKVIITDLAGASPLALLEAMEGSVTSIKYLITPVQAKEGLPSTNAECFVLLKHIMPHLDLDHLGESVQIGWKDGLSLGVYVLNESCMSEHPAVANILI